MSSSIPSTSIAATNRNPPLLNFYDNTALLAVAPLVRGKGTKTPPPNYRFNCLRVNQFRSLTNKEQEDEIRAFKLLPTKEKKSFYKLIQGTNYCDDAELVEKFPIQADKGNLHPPPTYRTSSLKVLEWRLKTLNEQKNIADEYSRLSMNQKRILWKAVPGIRRRWYYKPSRRAGASRTSTALARNTGGSTTGNSTTQQSTSDENNTSRDTNGNGNNDGSIDDDANISETPYGFSNIGGVLNTSNTMQPKRKPNKRKGRPSKSRHQQDKTSIDALNTTLAHVANFIETSCMHHPTTNPNSQALPDRNIGVLFCVCSHVNESPIRGFLNRSNIPMEQPTAVIMSNRRQGVKNMINDVLRDFINSSKEGITPKYEWETFFSDADQEPNHLTNLVQRRRSMKKKHRSLPRRGPTPVEAVDNAMPSDELQFSPVSFL